MATIPRLFFSYRRYDTLAAVGRICDRLEAAFGPGSVFVDFDHIRKEKEKTGKFFGCSVAEATIG